MPNNEAWNVATARVAANISLSAAYVELATPRITATAADSSSISIALTVPSPNSVSYTIERSLNGVDWAELVTDVLPGEFPYADTSLTAETQYFYRAFASDATDDSDYSPATSDTTPQAPGALTTIFSDDFESGGIASTANGFQWFDPVSVSVTSNNPKTGTKSLEFAYIKKLDGTDEGFSELSFDLGALYKEVEITFDLYVPDGTEPWGTTAWNHVSGLGSSNNKLMYLWPSDPSKNGGINSYNSDEKVGWEWYQSLEGNGGSRLVSTWRNDGGGTGPNGINRVDDDCITPSDFGTWINFRLHAKFPTGVDTNDGFNRAYRNGVLVVDNPIDLYVSTAGADHGWQHGYLLGYFNQTSDGVRKLHIDNFVARGVLK